MVSSDLALLGALVARRAGATQDELDFFIDRVMFDRTLEQIGREYGCTRANVGLRLRSARDKIMVRLAA